MIPKENRIKGCKVATLNEPKKGKIEKITESGSILIKLEDSGRCIEVKDCEAPFSLIQKVIEQQLDVCVCKNKDKHIISDVVVPLSDDLLDYSKQTKSIQIANQNEFHFKEQNIKIKGDQTLTLECGNSSITLNKNGKVVIKGDDIMTYASGSNTLRGAVININ